MTLIRVWHVIDGTVIVDKIRTDAEPDDITAQILPTGPGETTRRGHVLVPGVEILYADVQKIRIDEEAT